MSIHLPQSNTRHLPVEAIAISCNSFTITPELYHSAAMQHQLLQQVQQQGIVPMIAPTGHLEAMATDFSLLTLNVLSGLNTGLLSSEGTTHPYQLQLPLLLQEARLCLISLQSGQTVLDAQTLLCKTQYELIPIVDEDGCYTGYAASREKLLSLLIEKPSLPKIGGMATPLGVYLTSGKLSGGAGWQGLVLAGALFGVSLSIMNWLYPVFYSAIYAIFPAIEHLPKPWHELSTVLLEFAFILGSLLLMIRLTPLAGLHAAEHMTVNAIETGIPLTYDNVSQQPRVHKRCGTNIAIPLTVAQLAYFSLSSIHNQVSLLGEVIYLGLAATLLWKFRNPMGEWMQRNWTTKQPTAKQIASGIAAGKELLKKYHETPHATVIWHQRLLRSGIIHVFLGAIAAHFAGEWVIQTLLNKL